MDMIRHNVVREMTNKRVFFLHKGDVAAGLDSRSAKGLAAQISLQARVEGNEVVVQGGITNVGSAAWLPSMGPVGTVNIGVHMFGEEASFQVSDYARYALAGETTNPGQSRDVAFRIPCPERSGRFTFVIDLVAEGVSWFELRGTEPFSVSCVRDESGLREISQ